MIHKVSNGDGVEIRTISLTLHIAIVFGLITVIVSLVSIFAGRSWGAMTIEEHLKAEGHPVVIERVNTLARDIQEIKRDTAATKVAVGRIEAKLGG